MSKYYNPVTRPDAAKTVIQSYREVSPSHKLYHFYVERACESKEAVLAKNVSGHVYWFEGGSLMEGVSYGSFEFKPLLQEPSFIGGMNWNDAYFFTKEAAEEWAKNCGCRHDRVKHSEEYDVYSVHIHWIDNPDCMKVPSVEQDKVESVKPLSLLKPMKLQ